MTTTQTTIDFFKAKETAINAAIERVKAKLQYFADTCKDNTLFEDWNQWHDLHDRLLNRLADNWSDFKDWHFEKFGFNTYP